MRRRAVRLRGKERAAPGEIKGGIAERGLRGPAPRPLVGGGGLARALSGLLALLLLTDARRAARLDRAWELVPLAEQDRSRRDGDLAGSGPLTMQEGDDGEGLNELSTDGV